jgi:hypothetical protein
MAHSLEIVETKPKISWFLSLLLSDWQSTETHQNRQILEESLKIIENHLSFSSNLSKSMQIHHFYSGVRVSRNISKSRHVLFGDWIHWNHRKSPFWMAATQPKSITTEGSTLTHSREFQPKSITTQGSTLTLGTGHRLGHWSQIRPLVTSSFEHWSWPVLKFDHWSRALVTD